jgi:hypothetical protein
MPRRSSLPAYDWRTWEDAEKPPSPKSERFVQVSGLSDIRRREVHNKHTFGLRKETYVQVLLGRLLSVRSPCNKRRLLQLRIPKCTLRKAASESF